MLKKGLEYSNFRHETGFKETLNLCFRHHKIIRKILGGHWVYVRFDGFKEWFWIKDIRAIHNYKGRGVLILAFEVYRRNLLGRIFRKNKRIN